MQRTVIRFRLLKTPTACLNCKGFKARPCDFISANNSVVS